MPEAATYEPMTVGDVHEFLENCGYAVLIYRLYFRDHIETLSNVDMFHDDGRKTNLPVKTWMIEKFEGSDHIIFLNVFVKEDE